MDNWSRKSSEQRTNTDSESILLIHYEYLYSIMHGLDDKKSYHLPPTLPNPSARFSTLLSVRFFKLKDTGQWPPSCIYSCFGDGFKKCSVRYLEAPCKPTNRVVMLWWWWWSSSSIQMHQGTGYLFGQRCQSKPAWYIPEWHQLEISTAAPFLPRHVSATASSGTVTGWSKREARNVGRCPEKTDSSVSQKKYKYSMCIICIYICLQYIVCIIYTYSCIAYL